ncbi:MAG: protein kinase [Planctomycetota bacterium]
MDDTTSPGSQPRPSASFSSEEVEQAVEEAILRHLQGRSIDLNSVLNGLQDASHREEVRRRLEAFLEIKARLNVTPENPAERRKLGEFTIQQELGRGGMGIVYLARQESLNRDVALKVLPELSALAPERVERFLREASTLATLAHPHIVPVLVAGEERGVLYFAMEYVKGPNLGQILTAMGEVPARQRTIADVERAFAQAVGEPAGPPPGSYIEFICRIFIQVSDALAHAHGSGVLHRDLKPSNILLTREGEARLVDFGLSQVSTGEFLTRSLEILGTPHYLPPEIVEGGTVRATVRSDIYSLGASLYEALAGVVPFDHPSLPGLLRAIETGGAKPVRAHNQRVPRDLEIACMKTLEPAPEHRYTTAQALADDLRAAAAFRPIAARPPSPLRRVALFARRNRTSAVVTATALTGLLGLALFLVGKELYREGLIRKAIRSTWASLEARDAQAGWLAWETLTGLAKNHPERESLRRALALLECDEALEAARAIATERDRVKQQKAAIEPELMRQIAVARSEHMPDDERRELFDQADEFQRLELAIEELFSGLLAKLSDARTYAAKAGEDNYQPVLRAYADAYVTRWRETVAAGDEARSQRLAQLVRVHDLEGQYASELDGLGTLEIKGPDGAEVFLFRYQPLGEVNPSQWQRRLVPVPVRWPEDSSRIAAEIGLLPGDVCEVVQETPAAGPASEAMLFRGDLIVSVDGWRCDQGVYVVELRAGSAAAQAGIEPFDRVVTAGGKPCRSLWDIEIERTRADQTLVLELERPGWKGAIVIPREGPIAERSGMVLGEIDDLLNRAIPQRDLAITAFSAGELIEVEGMAGVPFGIKTRLTAYPLILCDQSQLGELPIADPVSLSPGSYLLFLRRDDFHDLMIPLVMPHLQSANIVAEMLSAELEPPADAVWIPPGRVVSGGDPYAMNAEAARTEEIPGFWMACSEVTSAQWRVFLSDPEVVRRIREAEARGQLILVPRRLKYSEPAWTRTGPGRYEPSADFLSYPVHFISREDAEAFVEWLNRIMEAAGSPWKPGLPTGAEYARAARGADRRTYPWGDTFDPGLCKGALSRAEPELLIRESGLRFLGDESPFGVRDLAGSVSEWSADRAEVGGVHLRRGGAWTSVGEDSFRIDTRGTAETTAPRHDLGVRLVFRPRDG